MTDELHAFKIFDGEYSYWWGAHNTEDALDQLADFFGYDVDDLEAYAEVDRLEPGEEIKVEDEGPITVKTAAEWVAEVGRGMIATTADQ